MQKQVLKERMAIQSEFGAPVDADPIESSASTGAPNINLT